MKEPTLYENVDYYPDMEGAKFYVRDMDIFVSGDAINDHYGAGSADWVREQGFRIDGQPTGKVRR